MGVAGVSLVTWNRRSSVVCLAPAVGFAAATGIDGWAAQQEAPSLGEQLVRPFWEAVRAADAGALEGALAPGFQSVHQNGKRDQDEELAPLAAIDIGDCTRTGSVTTRQGAAIVVTCVWPRSKRRSPVHVRRRSPWLE